jgi:hypothetical protein
MSQTSIGDYNRFKLISRSFTYILLKYLLFEIFNKFVDNKSFKPLNYAFIEKMVK